MADPTVTDPDKYKLVFENDQVRVLEYRDEPGQKTSPHEHPNSVVYTLSGFRRRFENAEGESVERDLPAGLALWIDAQTHSGENTGNTPTHVLFVELKGAQTQAAGTALGPSVGSS
jgi:quercetin dioxygenase-like cupin family protein